MDTRQWIKNVQLEKIIKRRMDILPEQKRKQSIFL